MLKHQVIVCQSRCRPMPTLVAAARLLPPQWFWTPPSLTPAGEFVLAPVATVLRYCLGNSTVTHEAADPFWPVKRMRIVDNKEAPSLPGCRRSSLTYQSLNDVDGVAVRLPQVRPFDNDKRYYTLNVSSEVASGSLLPIGETSVTSTVADAGSRAPCLFLLSAS